MKFHLAGQLADAEQVYRTVLQANPDYFDALHLLGVLEAQLRHLDEADRLLTHALASGRPTPDALSNHGNVKKALGRYTEALASYDHALAIQPDHVEALNNRGVVLQELHRTEDALASYASALAIKPDYADALSNRGNALRSLTLYEEAIASYGKVLALQPNHVDALNNRGVALAELNRRDDALASYDQALAIQPYNAELLNNRGVVLEELLRHNEALTSFDRALESKPDYAEALANRGHTLLSLNRPLESGRDLQRSLDLAPRATLVKGMLQHSKMQCCDWRERNELSNAIIADVRAGNLGTAPFSFLAISDSAKDQLHCAETWVREKVPSSPQPIWTRERYDHDRIRLAYLSADFRDSATSRLMTGLFELHDRTRFETTAISFGPDTPDEVRLRLRSAFERFIDVRQMSNNEVVTLLREMEIDIAVDLTGHARGARTAIFAQRAAPIQVNYLGFPGTMGADYFDYILADRYVIPSEQRACYAESVVYLPDTFQVNDAKRHPMERTPTRMEVGLPENAFVFCSFNNNFKLNPSMFDVWMRLLREIESGVLWLLGGSPAIENNLRREAAARGVAPDRLVFASRIGYEAYLARYRLADLFLDTLPFNAGTTASDALWTGTPLLTCSGEAFAARMGGSLLHALGLNELVTESLEAYESVALKIAGDPGVLAAVRQKLSRNQRTFPLFDTDRFRRHIEKAFVTMWEYYQRGNAPAGFAVPLGHV